MGDSTGISWTDATWNPVRGCSRVSEGCRNCYAERVAARFSGPGQPYEGLADRDRKGSKWTGVVRLIPEHLADPLCWRKPRRIFVNSMSDLFHENLSNEQIAAVFGVMAAAPQHTFQVLTKRARRMREWFRWLYNNCSTENDYTPRDILHYFARWAVGDDWIKHLTIATGSMRAGAWPLPNVWIGVSVENQVAADERIPELLRTPAAVRFLSCEPLIGPVDFGEQGPVIRWLRPDSLGVRWVIAGCESGPGARPCSVEWLRSLRDQCADAGVPFFLKQAAADRDPLRSRCPDCGEQIRWYVHGQMHSSAPCACTAEGAEDASWHPTIGLGEGSKRKAGGVIELPYLDGVQHAAFPEAPHAP